MNKEKRILSVRNMEVKFQVRGRFLTAIRNVNLDIFDKEILAIVGESGSGKSVITKTFTGMLESNGWISNGSIVYRPNKESVDDTKVYFKEPLDLVNLQSPLISKDLIKVVVKTNKQNIKKILKKIRSIYKLNPMFLSKKAEKDFLEVYRLEKKLSNETNETLQKIYEEKIASLKAGLFNNEEEVNKIIEIKNDNKTKYNELLKNKQDYLHELSKDVDFNKSNLRNKKINNVEAKIKLISEKLEIIENDEVRDSIVNSYFDEIIRYEIDINKIKPIDMLCKNKISKIILLIERFIDTNNEWTDEEKSFVIKYFSLKKHLKRFEVELETLCHSIINNKVLDTDHFYNILVDWKRVKNSDLVNKIKASKEVRQLRGKTISTVFQDPMTSLNPLLPVGFQITEVLRKQLGMGRKEAKVEAIELLRKVGITDPEKRFKDIPGRYSGGMRQRVVIAIALASRPRVLICDEPTTALDVTIQAQILDLIKSLQDEYRFTVIFITHDLGVVAKIADRIAVMYAGQIIEIGTVNDIFENAKHPYTWALLSSLPQLGKKGDELYSIEGTPPSLFNEIKGDAFAPRNKFALELDYIKEPPMFKISETHFAKTWLLDPRSPKVEKPAILNNLKETIREAEKVG